MSERGAGAGRPEVGDGLATRALHGSRQYGRDARAVGKAGPVDVALGDLERSPDRRHMLVGVRSTIRLGRG